MTGIQIRGFNFLMHTDTMKKAYLVEFSFNLTKRNLALYLWIKLEKRYSYIFIIKSGLWIACIM